MEKIIERNRLFLRAVQNDTLRLYSHSSRRRFSTDLLKVCRVCGRAYETLGHVLNRCRRHSRLYQLRHDAIQNTLVAVVSCCKKEIGPPKNNNHVRASREKMKEEEEENDESKKRTTPPSLLEKKDKTVVVLSSSVNKRVPHVDSRLRPDIVMDCYITVLGEEGKKSSDCVQHQRLLVDVTVPSEDNNNESVVAATIEESFERARRYKIHKYRWLADEMASKTGVPTSVETLIVGTLGTWDEKYNSILLEEKLGMTRKEASDLKRVVCHEALAWARRIYARHLECGKMRTR